MTISDSTLNSDIFTDVRTELVAANLAVTNETDSNTATATIGAQYKDSKTARPQVVIMPAETSESDFKFGSVYGKRFVNVTIECYYKSTLGVDQLADQVEEAIRRATFTGQELVAVSGDYAFNTVNDNKYHLKSITFTFDRE